MHGALPSPLKPVWFPDWSGQVCAIVASGPSVTQQQVDLLKGRCRVAVVNNNYQLTPWADVLYAADEKWWEQYKDARSFRGLKVTPDSVSAQRYGLRLVALQDATSKVADVLCLDEVGKLGRGGHGGFQLTNLVLQFGVRKIILLGFEFCGEHWHGKHPDGLKNPRQSVMDRWRETFDAQAVLLSNIGCEVVNASAASTLMAYPKEPLGSVLDRWCGAAANEQIDFAAAQTFLRVARDSHDKGNEVECLAARKLVAVALCLTEGPWPKLHIQHLKEG